MERNTGTGRSLPGIYSYTGIRYRGCHRIASCRHSAVGANEMDAATAELQQAKVELESACLAEAEAVSRVKACEDRVQRAQQSLLDAQDARLLRVKPCRVWVAYALWLLLPVWPGAYLFYLGRDAHCWIHTVTFGGFGIGWLVDAIHIPMYVADHNEEAGYREEASQRLKQWWRPAALLVSPFSLFLQLLAALYFGMVGAYLVPRPLILPGLDAPFLSRGNSAIAGFLVGMLVMLWAVRILSTRLGRARCVVRWKTALGWVTGTTALLVPAFAESAELGDESGLVPPLPPSVATPDETCVAFRHTTPRIPCPSMFAGGMPHPRWMWRDLWHFTWAHRVPCSPP